MANSRTFAAAFLLLKVTKVMGCVMNLSGAAQQVFGGSLTESFTDMKNKEMCLNQCNVRATCIWVEHNHGTGACNLFETVSGKISTGNPWYSVYQKECTDDTFYMGLFAVIQQTTAFAQISSNAKPHRYACAVLCLAETGCSVFTYSYADELCVMFKEDISGSSVCNGNVDCYKKL